jgi:hypothetical protein
MQLLLAEFSLLLLPKPVHGTVSITLEVYQHIHM